MALPKWTDIPVANRSSLKKYHEYIRKIGGGGESALDKDTLKPIIEEIIDDLLDEAEDNQPIGDPQVTEQQEI
jgi:hypothetical protein